MGLFKRLDITNIDLTKKENQTPRNWFALMYQNHYIQLFIVALASLIGMACTDFGGDNSKYFIMLIPVAIMSLLGYKAFYQFWDDQKKGISR